MCKLGGGANRCDAHWGPTQKAADLARRRAKYAAKKGGEVRAYTKQDAQAVIKEAKSLPGVDTSSVNVKAVNITNPMLKDESGNYDESKLKPTGEVSSYEELGLVSTALEGELVDNSYYSGFTVEGAVNWDNLDEESYRAFGFQPIGEARGSISHNSDTLVEPSRTEFSQLTESNTAALKLFTSESYEWINTALYNKSDKVPVCVEPEDGEDMSEMTVPEYVDEDEQTAEKLKLIVNEMDKGLATGPGQQRVVYRGLTKEKFHTYGSDISEAFETFKLGQEMVFDGYQSASYSPSVAGNYGSAFSSIDKWKGVILEIRTSSGVNVVSESHYAEEQEVLLPRNSRYMVVGKHAAVDYPVNMEGNKLENEGVYVIQLVEITENGDVASPENRPAMPPPLTDNQVRSRTY